MLTFAHYSMVAAILFVAGILCILTKRNLIAVLLGVELVLNGANLNFVALGSPRLTGCQFGLGLDGPLMAVFVIVLAAAEAALALAIVLSFYSRHRAADIDEASELKG
jgi:NADH-quinone oxidoreductase subunit K